MKRSKRWVLSTMILLAVCLPAGRLRANDGSEDLFKQACDFYKEGKFKESGGIYEKLFAEYPRSWQVAFDLGNVYFRLKQKGQAIAFYEKARKLKPRKKEIRENLAYVRSLIEYKIEDKRNWYLAQWLKFTGRFSWNETLGAFLLLYFFWMSLSLLIAVRRGGRRMTALRKWIFIFCLFSLLPLATKYFKEKLYRDAVVISETDLRYGPSKKDKVALKLSEGLTAQVRKIRGDWCLISFFNGESGWCEKKDLEVV